VKITDRTLAALRIVAERGPIRPKPFSWYFWPAEHLIHRRVVKCGHGSHRGGGAYQVAGGYLGKLQIAGLVAYKHQYYPRAVGGAWERVYLGSMITDAGLAVLGWDRVRSWAVQFRCPGDQVPEAIVVENGYWAAVRAKDGLGCPAVRVRPLSEVRIAGEPWTHDGYLRIKIAEDTDDTGEDVRPGNAPSGAGPEEAAAGNPAGAGQ
jgi:hypothetical protein